MNEKEIIKELHQALTKLLQAVDDEGWNDEGEDYEEQSDARNILDKVPIKYLQ